MMVVIAVYLMTTQIGINIVQVVNVLILSHLVVLLQITIKIIFVMT